MLGALAALGAQAQSPAAKAGDTCAVPAALHAAGETAQARAAYIAILTTDPSATCAIAALKAINAPPPPAPSCAAADALSNEGDLTEALVAYEKIGAANPCAATGIAVVQLCEQGKVEIRVGRSADAIAAFNQALAKNPDATCASKGLASLQSSWFTNAVTDSITWLEDGLTVIGIVIAFGFAFLLLGYIPGVQSRFLAIPLIGSLIGSFVAPRVTFAPFDDSFGTKCGAALTARIKERLLSYRDDALAPDSGDYDVDLGTGGEEFVDLVSGDSPLKSAVDNAADVSDQTKLVAAILGVLYWLLPIKRLTVSGVVNPATQPPSPLQPQTSVTLFLQNGNRQEAAVTLSAPIAKTSAPPAAGVNSAAAPAASTDDYLNLASPSAVWVQYEVAHALSNSTELEENGPQSYALVREGLDQQLARNYDGAEASYLAAIALNTKNWSAYVNRAILEVRRTDHPGLDPMTPGADPLAVVILHGALEDMRWEAAEADKRREKQRRVRQRLFGFNGTSSPYLRNPNYFRLGYQLAAQRLNSAIRHQADAYANDWFNESAAAAAAVISDADELLTDFRNYTDRRPWWRLGLKRKLSRRDARLQGFLSRTVIPGAELIRADATVRQKGQTPQQIAEANASVEQLRKRAEREEFSYRVYYNLACYEANWQSSNLAETTELHDRALIDFQKALRRANGRQRQEIIDWSQADPSFTSLPNKGQFKTLTLTYQAPPQEPNAVSERRGATKRKRGATKSSARSTPRLP